MKSQVCCLQVNTIICQLFRDNQQKVSDYLSTSDPLGRARRPDTCDLSFWNTAGRTDWSWFSCCIRRLVRLVASACLGILYGGHQSRDCSRVFVGLMDQGGKRSSAMSRILRCSNWIQNLDWEIQCKYVCSALARLTQSVVAFRLLQSALDRPRRKTGANVGSSAETMATR